MDGARHHSRRTIPVAVLLLAVTVGTWGQAQAQLATDNPRLARPASRLHRAADEPVFLTVHAGFGGAFQYDQGLLGYGASLVFRPGAAASFLDPLERWRTAMVLRIDHQRIASTGQRLLAGDLILRRYFADRGADGTEVLPFLGAGLGASDVRLPPGDGGGNSRNLGWLLEAGQEWRFPSDLLVVARAQYRRHAAAGHVVSTWSVSAAIGLPVPW